VSAPIYADPILDGAADPTVIRKQGTDEWWMFYTVRRANHDGPGVQWVHGSPIGVAVSTDGGASWIYRGTVAGLDDPRDPGLNTHWAPEVIWAAGEYHMYLSYLTGTPSQWPGHERNIVHFTSPDLENWTRAGILELSSRYVIDASVALCPDGLYRMWYKDEGHGSATYVASSSDLYRWRVEGEAIPGEKSGGVGHEGPNVFVLGGTSWMIVDEWRGQGVFHSTDALHWTRQGIILDKPGRDPLDQQIARHAQVVVQGDWAALFYFTHPHWDGEHTIETNHAAQRRTVIHWARLSVENGVFICDRDPGPLRLTD
jgi:hypothetical protein